MAEAGAIMGRACEGFIGCQLSSIHSESNDYSRADIDRSTQRHQPRIGRSGRRAVARASIGAGGGWGATHGIRSPRWVRQSCSVVSWPESDEGRVSQTVAKRARAALGCSRHAENGSSGEAGASRYTMRWWALSTSPRLQPLDSSPVQLPPVAVIRGHGGW